MIKLPKRLNLWERQEKIKQDEQTMKLIPTMKTIGDVNKKNEVKNTASGASEVHIRRRRAQRTCDFKTYTRELRARRTGRKELYRYRKSSAKKAERH